MRISGQLVAFGAMMLVGGAFLPTSQAHAFGQQWRPTVAHAPTQSTRYRRVANVPSFRPHATAPSPRYSAPRAVSTPPVMQPMVAMRPMTPPAYSRPVYPRAGYGTPNMWSAMPMWSNPFTQMAQAWQYPMPMHPRQYAWRPAEQPWLSQRVRPEMRRDRYINPTPPVDYRSRSRLSAVSGIGRAPVWRETRWSAASARIAPWRPALATYRSVPGRFDQRRPVPASQMAAAGMQRGYWRPDQGALAKRIAGSNNFRPVAYGRAPAIERLSSRQRVADRQLPGWVTTYRDAGDPLACDWCGGS